MAVILNQEY